MYVLASDQTVAQYPYTTDMLRRDNPQTSFPSTFSPATLAAWDVYHVVITSQPEYNPATEKCIEGTPILSGDQWSQAWEIVPLSEQEISANTERQWAAIRSERNAKIADCDWTQLDDTPLTNTQKQAWATYRQALRDITLQPDPFAIEWPVEP
jgi:hypothetical protein